MALRTVRYVRYLPLSEYRWIFRDTDWKWHLREPAANLLVRDYQAVVLGRGQAPVLADKFFLVAPFLFAPLQDRTELRDEPDLYLRFASADGTPAFIRECANQFGPLRRWNGEWVKAEWAPDIWREFCGTEDDWLSPIRLIAEPAIEWLRLFASLRSAMFRWSELVSRPIEERRDFLNHLEERSRTNFYGYGRNTSDLALHVDIDPQTGKAFSEIIASNLADLAWVQWGLSVAADIHHRQCEQCDKIFAVHAGQGRPDKRFCSVACRMRNYRMRKSAMSQSLTPRVKQKDGRQ